jgi:segregation and condensation protein B
MSDIINDADVINEETKDVNEDASPKDTEPAEERVVIFEEALEAILFAAGHPISYATLARVFEMTPGKVKDKVFEYSLKYNDPAIPRGVILLTYGDSCQLCTKKYYLNEIREALGIKRSGSLSTSSMEALAIVAYNQPVTRIFVDTLRRADSSYAMNNLIDRGLIESKGRLDAPGRPMLYGTTQDFLRSFGLSDLSALPNTSEELNDLFSSARKVDSDVLPEQQTMDLDGVVNEENQPEDKKPKVAEIVIDLDDEVSAEDDIIPEE